jgi:predicted AlkP superfamily pyrophosphatase or phosphodiesterase
MTQIAATVSECLGVPRPAAADSRPIQPIVADLFASDRLAIVAPDALGISAWGLWRHEMPILSRLHDHRGIRLRAVMPTITPVNFATMITGAPQQVHGIGAYTDDFQCPTLFDVLRAEGKTSAGVGQKGYTGSELLGRCADHHGCADSRTDDEVADITMELARSERPDFVICQLGSTDDAFHRHGPSSRQVVPVLAETDARLGRMLDVLSKCGYAVIVLADHGQHDTPTGGTHGTESDDDSIVPCTWVVADRS